MHIFVVVIPSASIWATAHHIQLVDKIKLCISCMFGETMILLISSDGEKTIRRTLYVFMQWQCWYAVDQAADLRIATVHVDRAVWWAEG